MKLSKAKQDELERLNYFGGVVKNDLALVTDYDVDDYFNFSERGIVPKEETRGYRGLVEAKRWQGIHLHEMYEPGILDGSMPYMTILGYHDKTEIRPWWNRWFYCLIGKGKYKFIHSPPPRSVVDFLKKEMFKGIDAEIIEKCYQDIIKE